MKIDFFFFKQKTAYEVGTGDWSSDVCSSDLLINKPDTEYTGQETYVWEMYNNRCWDFFPVGDCFRKQYETKEEGAS